MTTINRIIEATAEHYEITRDDLRGPSRERCFAYPRQVAMFIAREHFNYSLPEIGRALNRDHTTIMHGVAAVNKRKSAEERESVQMISENVLGVVFRSQRNYPMFKSCRAA